MPRFLFLCLLSTLLVGAPTDPVSPEKEVITQVIEDSIGWFKTKDFDRLFQIFPQDPNLTLIQPEGLEPVVGGAAFRKNAQIWEKPENHYLSHSIRNLRINLSESGTVAWWSALLDDCGSYGGKEFCWKNCRWTGVMEKRQEQWVITQSHFSFAREEMAKALRQQDAPTPSFDDYMAMRQQVISLFQQKQYAQAARILSAHLDRFPDHTLANISNLVLMARMRQEPEQMVYWLEEGHRRGLFFGIWAFEGEAWGPLKENTRFQAFLQANQKRIQKAEQEANLQVELVKPQGYRPEKAYPLFIALHGGGESIASFRPHWTSPTLGQKFIVAYVQSTQVADMQGFHWQNQEKTRQDLQQALGQIRAQVRIDDQKIVIGGFSSGGFGSLVALFGQTIPARGFVLLCPDTPDLPAADVLRHLKKRHVRGTLLSSEFDPRLSQQKRFVSRMKDAGIPVRLVVSPNTGHWYPENLSALIDQALNGLNI